MDDRFVNLGEEVILTLLWQSGASESATVSRLSICYWLFKCRVLHFVCVCVCVRARVCERERETGSYHNTSAILISACVQTHRSFITESVTRLCSSFGLELMVKLSLYIHFESWSSRLWKGALHFRRVLAVFGQSQCSGSVGQSEQTALVGRRDFVENEAFERGPTIMYSIWKTMCFLNIEACQHILLHQIHKIMIFKKPSYDPFNKCDCQFQTLNVWM